MRFLGIRHGCCFTVLVLLALGTLNGASAAAQDDAPYIYYYSRLLGAFVVERADGSDSRVFAPGLTPDEEVIVRTPGWSPSGEWFVWLSQKDLGFSGIGEYTVRLVDSDGQRMPVFEGMNHFSDAYWADDADILFLVDANYTATTLYRFDIAARQITVLFDGEFELPPRGEVPDTGEENIVSPDGRYRISRYTGTLTDIQTGNAVAMRLFSGFDSRVCDVNWHSGGGWLIRRDNMVLSGSGCGSGFVVANTSGTIQRELGDCGKNGACAGWLPENVVSRLAAGQAYSVVPAPLLTIQADLKFLMAVAWRYDGTMLAAYAEPNFYADDRSSAVLIWALTGGEWALAGTFAVDRCYAQFFTGCELEWSPDGSQIALTNDYETQIVDAVSGEIVFTAEESFAGWTADSTPVLTGGPGDSDYAAATGNIVYVRDGINGANSAVQIDSADGIVLNRYDAPGRTAAIRAAAFFPDGAHVALLEEANTPLVWALDSDRKTPLSVQEGEYLTDLTVAGRYVLSYGRATLVHIWDGKTAERLGSLNHYAYDVALSPDGRTLATVGGQALNLWARDTFAAP